MDSYVEGGPQARECPGEWIRPIGT